MIAGPSICRPGRQSSAVVPRHRRQPGLLEVRLDVLRRRRLGPAGRRLARRSVRLLEHGRRTRLPEQALEVLARLADGEDPLVRRVERLLDRAHVRRPTRAATGPARRAPTPVRGSGPRRRSPCASRVTGSPREPGRGTRPPAPRPRPAPRSPPRGRASVSPRTDCARTRRRCRRRARRRPRARSPSTAASTRRQPSSRAIGTMFRPEAPPPATSVTSRGIDALRDRDLADRPDDVLGGDRQRRVSGLVDAEPERTPRRPLDGRVRGVRVERQPPAEEVVGVDPAEHDRGVGDRRLACRRGRSRLGRARRRRSAGRRGAVRPGRSRRSSRRRRRSTSTSTARMPVMCPIQRPPSQVSRRVVDLAGGDEPDVEGRAARVADDQVAGRPLSAFGVRQRRDGRHRRARADRVDRPLGHLLRTPGAAERGGDEDVAVAALPAAGPARASAGSPASAASATRRSPSRTPAGTRG